VVANIKFFSRNDTFLKQIHHIFYNRTCKVSRGPFLLLLLRLVHPSPIICLQANEVKANLVAFSGLPNYYVVLGLLSYHKQHALHLC
jgi:hypothetical protein